jgi:hypothetical protein
MKPISSKTTMCSTRAAMESIAYGSQQRQAEKINLKHSQDKTYKQVLEVGDIGVIYAQPKTRNSCNHPFLPVMVTDTKISTISHQVTYTLCTQYGHLRGTFRRGSIQVSNLKNI